MTDFVEPNSNESDLSRERSATISPQDLSTDPVPTRSSIPNDNETAESAALAMVMPSSCGCGGKNGSASPQKVFALGKLFFDYGTRSRRTYFFNAMKTSEAKLGVNPDIDNPSNLYKYLVQKPQIEKGQPAPHYTILNGPLFASRTDVASLTWVLKLDETPVYAIVPMGPFAFDIHDTLVSFLQDQLSAKEGGEAAERISVAGVIVGEVRLFTGETVPVIQPDRRGMFSWTTSILAKHAAKLAGAPRSAENELIEFLTRVYDQTRNLGITSQERALNYAATDALMAQGAFKDVSEDTKFKGMELDTFTVTKSPICRPDFDCWDVSMIFYDPNNLQRARRGLRFTIDVSDVVPVMITDERKAFSLR